MVVYVLWMLSVAVMAQWVDYSTSWFDLVTTWVFLPSTPSAHKSWSEYRLQACNQCNRQYLGVFTDWGHLALQMGHPHWPNKYSLSFSWSQYTNGQSGEVEVAASLFLIICALCERQYPTKTRFCHFRAKGLASGPSDSQLSLFKE